MNLEPLEHFHITIVVPLQIAGIDISISNSVIWMWLADLVILLFFYIAFRDPQAVPRRMQAAGELAYLFIRNMVDQNIGPDGHPFIPLLFTLFYFILTCNLLGLLPGSFTPTSQIIVTGALAAGVFLFTLIIRVRLHGMGFFRAFAPQGLPTWLLPLMVPIEVLSFLARPVSLAVRLFANMTAGHTVLGVIAFFGLAMPWFIAWIPLAFSSVLVVAEVFIAVIQAYIFTILACVYMDDALHE